MTTLVLISMLLVTLYVSVTIIYMKGIPDSVSAMVYTLPSSWRHLWTIWMWAVSMLLVPSLMASLGTWQFIGFLWCASMAFCGALPLVKTEPNIAHNIFGIAAGILSQICVIILNPWWLIGWVFMLLCFIKKLRSKSCFISEAICYYSQCGALLC